MPSFTNDFEFEVFCQACGAGICNLCDEGHTKNRGVPFIRVTPCDCQTSQIDSLKDDVRALEKELASRE